MSKGVEEIGEMIRLEVERFVRAELLHHFSLTLEEGDQIAQFAKDNYCKRRGINVSKDLNRRVASTRSKLGGGSNLISGTVFKNGQPAKEDSGEPVNNAKPNERGFNNQ